MKLLLTTDWHLRQTAPKNRIDDFEAAQEEKVNQIIQIAWHERVDAILNAGDVFDAPTASYYLFQKYLGMFQSERLMDIHFIPVFGQHDLRYRTSKENTPLWSFIRALGYHIPTDVPFIFPGVAIYGTSYGEDIPKIITPDHFNILIIHKLVVQEKLWAQQENVTWANGLLIKEGFDLIVSGDNHQRFKAKHGNKYLFNMGSLMRMKSDQTQHKPGVVIFNTELRTYKEIDLEILPTAKVMDLNKIEQEKEKDEKLVEFVDSLQAHKDFGLHFEDNLIDYLGHNAVPEEIASIIKEEMNNAAR